MTILTNRDDYLLYGLIRYFESDRCFNNDTIQDFNKRKITAKELVTFDTGLMEMQEITITEVKVQESKAQQILAIIVRPEIEPNYFLETKKDFEFCGYDLVEFQTSISAITNCGASFDKAINYQSLNKYGLISSYKEAVLTQLDLNEKYPDESHAYCEIVEIWRYIISEHNL